MGQTLSKSLSRVLSTAAAVVFRSSIDKRRGATNERYEPTIRAVSDGYDQWIIDDGIEGYPSQHFHKYSKPARSGFAPPTTAAGLYKCNPTISVPI